MRKQPPAVGGVPRPTTSYAHLPRKGAVDSQAGSGSPDDRIIQFCQAPPKSHQALLVEIVALPNIGKSTTLDLVGKKLAQAGYLVRVMNNRALPIFDELKRLGEGVSLERQSRLIQYAGLFRVLASEVRKLRPHYNVILVEHHRAFFRAFECKGSNMAEAVQIVENALRGVRRPDLTVYLSAPPSLASERNKGRLTDDEFLHMYQSLESLAGPEAFHRVPVLDRSEDDIAAECFRVIVDRLNARFLTRAAAAR